MKDLEEIDRPSDPLKRIIRHFLHVEWYEADELRQLIETGSIEQDVDLLRAQFDELLRADPLPVEQLNDLTANDFESSDEARRWFATAYRQIFPPESLSGAS